MKKDKKLRFALVGTDTLKGREIISVLGVKKIPLQEFDFFDEDVEEEYSKLTQFWGEPKVVHHLERNSLEGMDFVFLAADRETSREYGRLAGVLGFQAVDLTEAFNDEEEVPLVVAGVNDAVLRGRKHPLIANPHPVTVFLSHLFDPLLPVFGLKNAVAFVLQPASAFDEEGVQELIDQSFAMLSSSSVTKKVFKEQVAFNLLSRTDKPQKDGFSLKEKQVLAEVRRVLGRPELPLTLSIIQAPVFHTYSIMVHLELEKETDIQGFEAVLEESPFLCVSRPEGGAPVSPVRVAGKEKIFVGQVKKDRSLPGSFWTWIVADNLIGSVLNASGIAQSLFGVGPFRG